MLHLAVRRSGAREILRVALLIACCSAFPLKSEAQTPVLFSPDITARLGTITPALVADDDAAIDDAAGNVNPVVSSLFAALPANVELGAIEIGNTSAAGSMLAIDTTVALPGLPIASPAEPRDVVRFDSLTSTFSTAFDGAVSSVPAGVRIDALALDSASNLLLSFDTSVTLPGAGAVDDEDLVRFAAGVYSVVFDGSAQGISGGLDLDAAHLDPGANILQLSFDGTGSVPGVTFDDEDVVAFDMSTLTYAMRFDASLSDPDNWPATDLVALPEPDSAAQLGVALCSLTLLANRHGRFRRRQRRGAKWAETPPSAVPLGGST